MVFTVVSFFALYMISHIDNADKKERERKRKETEERQQRERKEAEDSERKREEAYHQKMTGMVQVLNNQVISIKELYGEILDSTSIADDALNTAGDEFYGGYYAPFWDQIEVATNQLASCNNYLHNINSHVDKYWSQIQDLDKEYSGQVKSCVLPGTLPDLQGTAKRLATTVRMAQRNFEFSTIYEQRKTNKLLYEGFSNLGDAIYSLGDRITDSLNDLSRNLESSLNDILSATHEHSRIISDNIQEQTRRFDSHAEEQRRYESDSLRNQSDQQKTLEQQKRVLDSQNRRIDNIQRGRNPGLFDE
jgi:vacuolar-type H+-ATPase subunit E/Vma4